MLDPVLKKLHKRNYEKAHPRKHQIWKREWFLKHTYGITLEDETRMIKEQSGRCAICGDPLNSPGIAGPFCIDHDHSTGKIRGLLCDKCNRGIGCFNDDPKNLKSAIEYLGGKCYG
jgi:hypothetical protein